MAYGDKVWTVSLKPGESVALEGPHTVTGRLARAGRAAVVLLLATACHSASTPAEVFDVPAGTVASWLARSKAHLREVLTHD